MDPMGSILDRMGLTNPKPILDTKGPTSKPKKSKKNPQTWYLAANELTQI